MERLTPGELSLISKCPECGGSVSFTKELFSCNDCQHNFITFQGKPVLPREDNELFPPTEYMENAGNKVPSKKTIRSKVISSIVPSKSINLARTKVFKKIAQDLLSKKGLILVIGCGNQVSQIEKIFQKTSAIFVFCDIDKSADVDLFCDSHCLPFLNECFDGVISTAVMEHVFYPEKVIEQINNVLKPGAFIYSEIPFLQSVHEGAYDFTRYTLSGHRRLMEFFQEVDTGIVAGPGTALVWSIDDFFKSLSRNSKIAKLLSIVGRIFFSWLKYIDHLTQENPQAINAASCTYFFGKKKLEKTSPETIIKRYQGISCHHV